MRLNDTEILARAATILENRAKYNTKRDVFSSPDAVRQYLLTAAASIEDGDEHFRVLFLDNRHSLLASEVLFHGTIDSAAVYPRTIVRKALEHNAAACIFHHNHPSGTAEPSDTDVRLTRKLVDALALIDVRALDHLVTGDGTTNCTSLAERGLM